MTTTTGNTTGTCFRVLLRMELHPGREKEFEEAWTAGADVITSQPANLGQWLAASTEEPSVYYIVSDWTDEAGFREYELSETHLEHRKRLHPYRKSGSMSVMTVIRSMTGAAAGA
ncbi:antibiotic biosynthesis monooxygenase family protein [Streptomyces sp. MST-110588]|uniref:antibiotic biosynthesis monooxygenase family protein n=1 Tax=Streptomyces sp. MST-110588 TaxID=2833628 RepID=UPI001F5D2AAA|nr:antibiotic biosynthesis monooxygenase family protein [Streptomyces sp. MST-110588]UNO40775.1 antibiotic biosynthesis monooxygenase [Streptomyces sp. MST-110588]